MLQHKRQQQMMPFMAFKTFENIKHAIIAAAMMWSIKTNSKKAGMPQALKLWNLDFLGNAQSMQNNYH